MAACTAIISHLVALANAAKDAGVSDIMVHAFTDGRDTSPTGGADFLATLHRELQAERRAHRHGRRPLLRDGPRQALGADEAGVGRDRLR